MKLSKKQKEFLGYISLYIDEWGQSPSFVANKRVN